MPKVSALIHTANQGAWLERLLGTLRGCDEILVVDHDSADRTRKIAREHGALVKKAVPGVDDGAYVVDCHHHWILCLLPNKALREELRAALLEWKQTDPGDTAGYTIQVREFARNEWHTVGREPRLANRSLLNRTGKRPLPRPAQHCPNSPAMGCDSWKRLESGP